MAESDSGLRSSFSSKLTMSTKCGRLERSCVQHCSISWLTADGQHIGAGNLKPSFMDFITFDQKYEENGEAHAHRGHQCVLSESFYSFIPRLVARTLLRCSLIFRTLLGCNFLAQVIKAHRKYIFCSLVMVWVIFLFCFHLCQTPKIWALSIN